MLVKKQIGNDTLIFGGGYEVLRLFRRCTKNGAYRYSFCEEPAIGFHYDGSPRMYGILLSWGADEEGYYKGEETIDWLTAEDVAFIAMGGAA